MHYIWPCQIIKKTRTVSFLLVLSDIRDISQSFTESSLCSPELLSISHNALSSEASYTCASSRRSRLWESSITRKAGWVTQWNTGGDRMLFIFRWATFSTKMNGGSVRQAKSRLYFLTFWRLMRYIFHTSHLLHALPFLHFLLKLRCRYWCAGLSTLCFICG